MEALVEVRVVRFAAVLVGSADLGFGPRLRGAGAASAGAEAAGAASASAGAAFGLRPPLRFGAASAGAASVSAGASATALAELRRRPRVFAGLGEVVR